MKRMKRGIAVLLAAAVMVPEFPVSAVFGVEQKPENHMADSPVRIRLNTPATSSNAPEKKKEDGVVFNTGNMPVHVTEEEAFEEGLGDVCFEEDGSYTIEIPESDPFFPYEVQFTWDGKTDEKWFMTPEDSVTVDGHTFYVNGNFDGSAVTRFNLEVAGTTVPVYPERKEFTDDGGIMPLSLLPLEEKSLTVDLTGFTPVELTQVAMKDVFAGEREFTETDRIMWTWRVEDDYEISLPGDKIDLSCNTYNGGTRWEMIVGDDDQLAASNIRYQIEVETTESIQWLIPSVYEQAEDGTRKKLIVGENSQYYEDNSQDNRYLSMDVAWEDVVDRNRLFLGLEVNQELFEKYSYDQLKVYTGQYADAEEAAAQGTEITEKLFAADMTKADAGWSYPEISQAERWVTLVAYDADGSVCGCLPFQVRLYYSTDHGYVWVEDIYTGTGEDRDYVEADQDQEDTEDYERVSFTLEYGLDAADPYYLVMRYSLNGEDSPESVTAAFVGRYASIKEAEAAGAENIAVLLFDQSEEGGYPSDYSKGVEFTIFAGEDGEENQEIYHYLVETEEGDPELNSSTAVQFTGLNDDTEHYVYKYRIPVDEDDYAEGAFTTFFVEPDTDLTKLAPVFYTGAGIHLYAEGSSTPEVSGKSVHDFSKGAVQYTASAENGTGSRNYWLQIIKAEEGDGKLYINSLADVDAETKEEDGVIHSIREMFLDGRYDYKHDIVVANVGTEPIENLTAEVVSDEVELDNYWTLKGEYALAGMDSIRDGSSYGELSNMAKLRLVLKDGVDDGREINGTLTLRSGDEVLMVLTLTGIAGDPGILTKEIPDAVKYVPYGTMIQNSNKYEWNKVSYEIDGDLPAGMTLKPNGEIYGVPTETGEFTFTVTMENSFGDFSDSQREFTMTVLENTDANVDAATDEGYYLKEKVQNVSLASSADQTLVSNGEYGEFTDIFLDGVKLVSGVDYTSESGSTRITIRSQTLKASNQPGTHTLGVEFRTKDTSTLKRAAQNYQVTEKNNGGNGGNSDGGSSGGGSGSSSGSGGGNGSNGGSGNRAEEPSPITWTSGRGYVHNTRGVITGEGAGYAHWVQDDRGWKLVYPNGSFVTGAMMVQEDQSTVEQVAWEMVNGSWYAFGADGYIKSGWVFDYQLGRWYNMSIDRGMQTGWYTDPQDQYTYYMEPGGQLATGWKQIESNWYYFNAVIAPRTWEIDPVSGNWYYNIQSKSQPFGSLYRGKTTPDGYFVDENGVWNGNRIQ